MRYVTSVFRILFQLIRIFIITNCNENIFLYLDLEKNTKMSSTHENQLNSNGNDDDSEWLNQEFLEKVLNKYEGHPVHIENFTIQPATKKGENYASCMNLVKLEYSNMGASKTISLIIKSQLKTAMMEEITEEFNIFEREIQVYSVLLAKFEHLLRTINDQTSFGPR